MLRMLESDVKVLEFVQTVSVCGEEGDESQRSSQCVMAVEVSGDSSRDFRRRSGPRKTQVLVVCAWLPARMHAPDRGCEMRTSASLLGEMQTYIADLS